MNGDLELFRARFTPVWGYLPSITLLAALPGWGRTTWMRQCMTWLSEHEPATNTVLVRSRNELTQRIARRTPDSDPALWIVDDLLASPTDPLWEEIGWVLTQGTSLRMIISCRDVPRHEVIHALHPLLLSESELAFDAAEISELTTIALGDDSHVDLVTLTKQMRGCPALVQQHLHKMTHRRAQVFWAAPGPAPELSLLYLLPPDQAQDSAEASNSGTSAEPAGILHWLRQARGFRTFTVDLLAAFTSEEATPEEQLGWFIRATAIPLFTRDTDDETGAEALTWTAQAWAALDSKTSREQRAAELHRSADRIISTGRTVLALFPLLQLNELERAESLVSNNFRDFLMFTDGSTFELLRAIGPDPSKTPTIALLEAELQSRADGFSQRTCEIARIARAMIDARTPGSFNNELSRAALSAFAAVSAGERDQAHRTLDHIGQLIDALKKRPSPFDTPFERTRLIGRLHLAYWSALQLDRHSDALSFATCMVDLSESSDRLFALEQVSLSTQQDLAGIQSLSRTEEEAGVPSQAISLRYLEDAEDARALEVLRPLITRSGPAQSRSAIDALLLLVRCQSDSVGLSINEVNAVISRSSSLWRNGIPSSFVAWAAIVACSTIGAHQQIPRLSTLLPRSDAFSCLGRAAAALSMSDFRAVIGAAYPSDARELPRLTTVLHVYRAAAHFHLGNEEGSIAELIGAWREVHSTALIRFALRFLPRNTADGLIELARRTNQAIPISLVGALDDAAGDPRPVSWQLAPSLTRSELEILRLMQLGLKNTEIASERFITLGTLRTQIRTMYRKLNSVDRAEALSAARSFRLLPQPEIAGEVQL